MLSDIVSEGPSRSLNSSILPSAQSHHLSGQLRSAFRKINQPDARLQRRSLPASNTDLEIPNYLNENIRVGHVHIGPGDLFRSLIAPLAHATMQLRLPGYETAGIAAISLRGSPAMNTLQKQDGLYSLIERGPEKDFTRVIASVQAWVNGRKQPARVLQLLTNPGVNLLSLTITQQGYNLDSKDRLRVDGDEIRKCLSSDGLPLTVFGFIVEALRIRMRIGLSPFVLMPCDNLPDKSRVTKNAVLDYAAAKEKLNPGAAYSGLTKWIEDNLYCPMTMVDRITPNKFSRSQKISRWYEARRLLGLWDGAALFAEPYKKMVVQKQVNDREIFPSVKPAILSAPGCGLSPNIELHEKAKRLMLNGMHVVFGWIGSRMGLTEEFSTVQDLMRVPQIERFVSDLVRKDIRAVLEDADDLNLVQYADDTLNRFVNERLPDQLTRLNEYPATKFPDRVLPTIAAAIERNRRDGINTSIEGLVLAVACWFCSRKGIAENGSFIRMRESEQLASTIAQTENLDQFLSIGEIWERVPVFGNQILPQQPEFRQALQKAVKSLSGRSVMDLINQQ